ATDPEIVNLGHLDLALRIHQERTAQRESFLLDQHAEIATDQMGGIAQHRKLDLADGLRSVVPRLVRKVRVGRYAIDLDAELLELRIHIGYIPQLGGTDEGEIGGVEEKNRPLSL